MFTVTSKRSQFVVVNGNNATVDLDGNESQFSHAAFGSESAAQQLADKLNGSNGNGGSSRLSAISSRTQANVDWSDRRSESERYAANNSVKHSIEAGKARWGSLNNDPRRRS